MSTVPPPASSPMVAELIRLLESFDRDLTGEELRHRVQALVPINELLAQVGASLIPREIASSARDRLLFYFRSYPQVVLPNAELRVVAAISEWARRVRELRVEYGWPILSGEAAKEMLNAGELGDTLTAVAQMANDDYILVEDRQDRDAAFRWRSARDIRRQADLSVRARLLKYLRQNIGREVTGEELRYVAGDATEWARRVRELRTEEGWPVVTKYSGRPDIAIGMYVLEADRQSPPHDRKIADDTRSQALRRDSYKCRRCGWSHREWNRSDPRHLELHHIWAHAAGGENSLDNLVTLCTVCHDLWHRIVGDSGSADFDAFMASR